RRVLFGGANGPFLLLLGRSAAPTARVADAAHDARMASLRGPGVRAYASPLRRARDPPGGHRGRLLGLLELDGEASNQSRALTVKRALRLRERGGGLATALTESGESSGPKRRRRRRARREAEATANPGHGQNGENGQNGTPEASETVAETVAAPVAVLEDPDPADQGASPPPELDEFRDLLDQAVGPRLFELSRECGGRNVRRVTALHHVELDHG